MSEFTTTIIQKNEHLAKLAIETGGEITLPQKYLPRNLQIKDKVYFTLLNESQYEKRRKNIAQAILLEILGSQEKTAREEKGIGQNKRQEKN